MFISQNVYANLSFCNNDTATSGMVLLRLLQGADTGFEVRGGGVYEKLIQSSKLSATGKPQNKINNLILVEVDFRGYTPLTPP